METAKRIMDPYLTDFIKQWDGSGKQRVAEDVVAKLNEAITQLREANDLLRSQNKVLRFEKDELQQRNNKIWNKVRMQRREIRRMNAKLYTNNLEKKLRTN